MNLLESVFGKIKPEDAFRSAKKMLKDKKQKGLFIYLDNSDELKIQWAEFDSTLIPDTELKQLKNLALEGMK